METEFFSPEVYKWIVLPLAIFIARAFDEAIGTLRIIFLAQGKRILAPLLGFFEVLIWIVIIGQIMQNLDNVACYVAYAAGFATGSFVGMWVEERLAMGVVLIQLITHKNTVKLEKILKEHKYGFVNITSKDIDGLENVLFIIIQRSELDNVTKLIKEFHPKAFFTIEDVRSVNEGRHPLKRTRYLSHNKLMSLRRVFNSLF